MPSTSLIPSSTSGSKLQNNALPLEDKKSNWLIPLLFQKTVGPGRLILDFLLEDLQGVGSLAGINREARQFIIDAGIDKQDLLQKEIYALTSNTPQGRVQSLFIALVRSPFKLVPLSKIEVEKSIQQRNADMEFLFELIGSSPLFPESYTWIAERLKLVTPALESSQIQHLCNYLSKLSLNYHVLSEPVIICNLLKNFKPFAKDEVNGILSRYLASAAIKRVVIREIEGERRIEIDPMHWLNLDWYNADSGFLEPMRDQIEAVLLQRISFLHSQNVALPLKVYLSASRGEREDKCCKSLADKIAGQGYGDSIVTPAKGKESIKWYFFDEMTWHQIEDGGTYYVVSLNPPNSPSGPSRKRARLEESEN